MLKLFRTARFLFGLLAVLSLLLLPSLSPYRTMASPGFLDPTSADKADDDHGGSVPTWRCQDDHGGRVPHLAMPTRQKMTMAAAAPHLAMPMSPPLTPHPPTSSLLIIILRQRWPQIALGSGLRQPEKLQPGHGQAANVHRVPDLL